MSRAASASTAAPARESERYMLGSKARGADGGGSRSGGGAPQPANAAKKASEHRRLGDNINIAPL